MVDQLAHHATKNKAQRLKTWWMYTVELGYDRIACRLTIYAAFYARGFARYLRSYKPFLSDDMKLKRRRWASYYNDQDWCVVLFTDESPIVCARKSSKITRT